MESLVNPRSLPEFWRGKRVLVTGHTGFKGSWLSLWLTRMGADVAGLALAPDPDSLFDQLKLEGKMDHAICDIRDLDGVMRRVEQVKPDIVLNLAAQSLVLASYQEPVETWAVNVMGTVNVMEAVHRCDATKAFLGITTDKVYSNQGDKHSFREGDALGAADPYSGSKAACELAIQSYRTSYLKAAGIGAASARAGNVIGGGDWAQNRLIPDLVRALRRNETLSIRNPASTRPWQHVLDPLQGYLTLCEALWHRQAGADAAFNFGPGPSGDRTVEDVIATALEDWPGDWTGQPITHAPHESAHLALNVEKAQAVLGWSPTWDFGTSVRKTMQWYRSVHDGIDPIIATVRDIDAFEAADGV